MKETTKVLINFHKSVIDQLDIFADYDKVTRSALLREAVRDYLHKRRDQVKKDIKNG